MCTSRGSREEREGGRGRGCGEGRDGSGGKGVGERVRGVDEIRKRVESGVGEDDGGGNEWSEEGEMRRKDRREMCRIGGICREEEMLNGGMSGREQIVERNE